MAAALPFQSFEREGYVQSVLGRVYDSAYMSTYLCNSYFLTLFLNATHAMVINYFVLIIWSIGVKIIK